MPEAIGIDHVYRTVSDLAASETFYDRVMLEALGFRKSAFTLGGDPHLQYFDRRFGFVLRPARDRSRHEPYAPGLPHVCLRVESAADVEALATTLRRLGIEATEAKLHLQHAPDYVVTFFEDPDGVRLEVTNDRQQRRDRRDGWELPGTGS